MNIPFKSDVIEPVYKSGYDILNPQSITSKFASNYKETLCDVNDNFTVTYTNPDPRMYSASRDQRLKLDSPPIQSKYNPNTIAYDKSLNGYGKKYNSYNDVTGGQIVYYVNRQTQGALISPLFTIPSYVNGSDYIDPMGSVKPSYDRATIVNDHDCSGGTSTEMVNSQLSFIRDTTVHREDILHNQMSKINREKYGARMYT